MADIDEFRDMFFDPEEILLSMSNDQGRRMAAMASNG